jgi:vacuolar-type H+-ATPase subunit H
MIQHSETSGSPLAIIREKERAFDKEIRAALERANARVAKARARGDEIKVQAEQDGVREAETLYQEGLVRARIEASAIAERGEADAVLLLQAGRMKIQKAVDHIIRFVLPKIDNNEPNDV